MGESEVVNVTKNQAQQEKTLQSDAEAMRTKMETAVAAAATAAAAEKAVIADAEIRIAQLEADHAARELAMKAEFESRIIEETAKKANEVMSAVAASAVAHKETENVLQRKIE